MSKPDPRSFAAAPSAPLLVPGGDESDAWADEADDTQALWRLFGAATLAVLAMALASVVLV